MPRYLIVRTFEVGSDQMPAVGRRSRELTEEDFPEIVWEHSHVVVDDDGTVRTYCVYEAPTEDIVREHGRMLGQHTIEGLHEIAGDVTPADFPAPVEAS
jgi:alkyl hydroperoxide reductase subunit AhpC